MKKYSKQIVFLNGEMIAANSSLLSRLTPCLMEWKGAFETMRVCNGKILLVNEHMNRLLRGLKILGVKCIYSKKNMISCMRRTLDANGLKDARLRLIIRKYNRKIDISVVASAYHPFSIRKYKNGFRAVLAKDRYKGKLPLSNVKAIDYGFYCKAYLQASRQGCDEAIILNRQGYVVEGSHTNIFLVQNKSLITPSLKCGCLNGIIRKVVIGLAKEKGIKCKATFIRLENFMEAEEAFLTNSLIGIMPVTCVNNQKINKGRVGSLTSRLTESYKYFVNYYLKKD